jgi:syntaxin 18
MDITPLFKACVKTVRLQRPTLPAPDKNRILKKSSKDEFSQNAKRICHDISELRNFLIENRAAYMKFACFLKRSIQMTNEERDIIDRESEKILNICTQRICDSKNLGRQNMTKQQREHNELVIELLADYLKAVYNLFNDQKNYRIKRDLESYKYLKLDSAKRKNKESIDFSKIKYKDDLDLLQPEPKQPKVDTEEFEELPEQKEERKSLIPKSASKSPRKSQIDEDSSINPSLEDDIMSSSQLENELSPDERQMLEIENKQIFNQFQGLAEDVQQIEKHVYDIAKLQDLFTEKVSNFFGDSRKLRSLKYCNIFVDFPSKN